METVNRTDSRPIVVGLGEILWDMLPDGHRQMGGAPANFAYHAQALGARGVVVSRVGDDDLGREILDRLGDLGLDTQFVDIDPDHPTGTVTVELDDQGKPDFTIHENVAWDHLSRSPEAMSLAERADAVCYGTLAQRGEATRQTVRAFLDRSRRDCLRTLDVNLRQRYYDAGVLRELLGRTDVLKLSDDELLELGRLLDIGEDEETILAEALERYELRLIALTRGSKGSLLYAKDDRDERGAAPADVVDTIGAGDSFTAALVTGLLAGWPLGRINEHAARVAAYVCGQSGATPELPGELRVIGS